MTRRRQSSRGSGRWISSTSTCEVKLGSLARLE
jgi:hypothetical protein